MTLDLTKRFLKDVSKIKNKDVRIAITEYLELVRNAQTIEELRLLGYEQLKGNLKNLFKLKHKSFSDYRLLGCWKGDKIMLMLLAEQRNSVYKHKDDLAKYAGRI